MATLMPRRLIAQQGSDAKVPAEDLRLALSALFAPGVGANVARSGIVRGSGAAGFTACQVLSTSASTFTVKQGAFIVQQSTTNGGAYIGIVDSDQTLSISTSLPTSGNYKAGYVIAHCYDEAYGDAQDGFALEVLLGAQASSVGAAGYPAVPSNALILSGFTVTATGVITLTTAPVYTGVHNGILPVLAGDTASGVFDGQWRDEPAKGLQRWFAGGSGYSGSAGWFRPLANYLGSGAAFPTSGMQYGDSFLRTDLGLDGGTLWVYTPHASNPWRFAESGALQVANQAGRDAITIAYPGLQVVQADTGAQWEWHPVIKGWVPILRTVVGNGQVSVSGAGQFTFAVSFGTTFASTPSVTVSGTDSSADFTWWLWAYRPSTTGFSLVAKATSAPAGSIAYNWIAVGS